MGCSEKARKQTNNKKKYQLMWYIHRPSSVFMTNMEEISLISTIWLGHQKAQKRNVEAKKNKDILKLPKV
jgi:hypothetical protein